MERVARKENGRDAYWRKQKVKDEVLSVFDQIIFWIFDACVTFGMLYVLGWIIDTFWIDTGLIGTLVIFAIAMSVGFRATLSLVRNLHKVIYNRLSR